ncbi:hypothetical protein HaLaN_31235 [Haematococcus lacustris]|uniref:Uncharacterized protein n=1 Tax=Haematococcus lacustris TaxID=44745 RepID=A0A6A0AH56_HAELA|nr:hypothetical protein HaLaN_31235 [Haematococcus lacustris]
MRDAGMLGVLTEERVTSLDKFRNGALPDPENSGKYVEGPKDSQDEHRQYYRDSGITRQARATKTWLAQVKPQLKAMS